jgi:hypothetical protein
MAKGSCPHCEYVGEFGKLTGGQEVAGFATDLLWMAFNPIGFWVSMATKGEAKPASAHACGGCRKPVARCPHESCGVMNVRPALEGTCRSCRRRFGSPPF